MTSRDIQAANTKKRILEVAMELLREYGYEQITIQQICEKARVSTGAFYHHFKSKQGIIIEGYKQCDSFFQNRIIGNLTASDPLGKILEYIGEQMKYADSFGVDLMIEVYKAQITEGNDFFLSSSRNLPQGLLKLIAQAQESGQLVSSADPQDITGELLLISRGVIYNWCQNRGTYPLVEHCRKLIDNYLTCYMSHTGSPDPLPGMQQDAKRAL